MVLIQFQKRILATVFQFRQCHSVFGINNLVRQERPDKYQVLPVSLSSHDMSAKLVKQHYLREHVLVQARRMDLTEDRAIDEYLIGLMRQGNSLYARTEDGGIAGICLNFASSAVDPSNLRHYAFYRQDPNTKDFLYFLAKLQETPNLWKLFHEPKIFEIKMLVVLPEYRRQGLALMLAEKSKELARDQGYKVVRMDCINPYDYKIAEHCMMRCLVKYPLHKLRGANAPFIKKSSEQNRCVRVYVDVDPSTEKEEQIAVLKKNGMIFENITE